MVYVQRGEPGMRETFRIGDAVYVVIDYCPVSSNTVEPVAVCCNPEQSIRCDDEIGDRVIWGLEIIGIEVNPLETLGIEIEPVQTRACPDPDYAPRILLDNRHCVRAQAIWIFEVGLIMPEGSIAPFETIQAIGCSDPERFLVILKDRGNPVAADTVWVERVVFVADYSSSTWIEPGQSTFRPDP